MQTKRSFLTTLAAIFVAPFIVKKAPTLKLGSKTRARRAIVAAHFNGQPPFDVNELMVSEQDRFARIYKGKPFYPDSIREEYARHGFEVSIDPQPLRFVFDDEKREYVRLTS